MCTCWHDERMKRILEESTPCKTPVMDNWLYNYRPFFMHHKLFYHSLYIYYDILRLYIHIYHVLIQQRSTYSVIFLPQRNSITCYISTPLPSTTFLWVLPSLSQSFTSPYLSVHTPHLKTSRSIGDARRRDETGGEEGRGDEKEGKSSDVGREGGGEWGKERGGRRVAGGRRMSLGGKSKCVERTRQNLNFQHFF